MAVAMSVVIGSAETFYHMTCRDYGYLGDEYDYRCRPMPEREKRMGFFAGKFDVEFGEGFSDEFRRCVLGGVDIVEHMFPMHRAVRVKFERADLGRRTVKDDGTYYITTEADVRLIEDKEADVCCPTALYRQSHDVDFDGYDAVIYITDNRKVEWDLDHSADYFVGKLDLTYYVMRALCRTMGLCTAISMDKDELPVMELPALTPFDKKIHFSSMSGLVPLSSFGLQQGVPSPELADAMRHQSYFVYDSGRKDELWHGKIIIGEPGYYFNSGFSLMGMYLWHGRTQVFDAGTVDMLDDIGWDYDLTHHISNKGAENQSGVLVSNEFLFYSREGGDVVDSELTLLFETSDGEVAYQQTVSDYPWIFNMPSEEVLANCEINVNGDICGYISGWVKTTDSNGDIRMYQEKYRLSIPQKPAVISARFMDMIGDRGCVMMSYRGADRYNVKIYDKNNTLLSEENVFSPYISCYKFPVQESLCPLRLEFTVSNGVGEDTFVLPVTWSEISGVEEVASERAWRTATLYRLDCTYVGSYDSGEAMPVLDGGVYVVVYSDGSIVTGREKIVI